MDKQGQPDHKYTYNGKEKQEEFGLDWHDYGARNYDPVLGRWHVVDPLASEMSSWSPYNYGYNNPIKFIDPEGKNPEETIEKGVEKAKQALETATAAAEELYNATSYYVQAIKAAANLDIDEALELAKLGDKSKAKSKELLNDSKRLEAQAEDLFSLAGFEQGLTENSLIKLKNDDPQKDDVLDQQFTVENGRLVDSEGNGITGIFNFVITQNGQLKIGKGHYYLSQEANYVQMAGGISVIDGALLKVDNDSGHYQPLKYIAEKRTINLLKGTGVDTSNTTTDFKDYGN